MRTSAERRAEAARARQITQANMSRAAKPTAAPKEGNEWVYNFMSNVWVQQAINTPHCCRVDSETYWSM